MVLILAVVSLVSAFAADTYKVKYVKIGSYSRGTEVICEGLKCFYSVGQRQFTSFFNSLRAGDIIEVEEYENKIMAIRKIGHEAPEGMTNGVIVNNGAYGYYGGAYGSASVETKNVGVGYDPYTGVHVRVKGTYVNLPIRIKSKKSSNSTYTTANNGGMVTASPATQPNVKKTVSVDELVNANSNANSVVKATPARSNTTTTTVTRSASKLYDASGRLML